MKDQALVVRAPPPSGQCLTCRAGGTQTVRTHRIASRPQAKGTSRPLRLCHNARDLTDGAGLVLVRQLWDRLQLGARIDRRTAATAEPGL